MWLYKKQKRILHGFSPDQADIVRRSDSVSRCFRMFLGVPTFGNVVTFVHMGREDVIESLCNPMTVESSIIAMIGVSYRIVNNGAHFVLIMKGK